MTECRWTYDGDLLRHQLAFDPQTDPGSAARLSIGDAITVWCDDGGGIVECVIDAHLTTGHGGGTHDAVRAIFGDLVADRIAGGPPEGEGEQLDIDDRTAATRAILGDLAWQEVGRAGAARSHVDDDRSRLDPRVAALLTVEHDPDVLTATEAMLTTVSPASTKLDDRAGFIARGDGNLREVDRLPSPRGGRVHAAQAWLPAVPDIVDIVDVSQPARVVWNDRTGEVEVHISLHAALVEVRLWARFSRSADGLVLALAPVDRNGHASTILATGDGTLAGIHVDATIDAFLPVLDADRRDRERITRLAAVAADAAARRDRSGAAEILDAAAEIAEHMADEAAATRYRTEADALRGPLPDGGHPDVVGPVPASSRRRWWVRARWLLFGTLAIGATAITWLILSNRDSSPPAATAVATTLRPAGVPTTTTPGSTTSVAVGSTAVPVVVVPDVPTTNAAVPLLPTSVRYTRLGTPDLETIPSEYGASWDVELLDSTTTVAEGLRIRVRASRFDVLDYPTVDYETCAATVGQARDREFPFRREMDVAFAVGDATQSSADDIGAYGDLTAPVVLGQARTAEPTRVDMTRSAVVDCRTDDADLSGDQVATLWEELYAPVEVVLVLPPLPPGPYTLVAILPLGIATAAEPGLLHFTIE